MSSPPQGQFQLFPAMQSSSRAGSNGCNAATRVHRPRRSKSPRMSPVLEDAKVSGQTEAVILQIIEDTNSIIPAHSTPKGPRFSSSSSSREDKIFVFPQPQRRVSPSPSTMSRSTMSKSTTESPSPNSRANGNAQHKFAVFPPPRSSTSTPNRSKSTTASSRQRATTVSSTNSPGDSGTWSSPSPSDSEPRELSSSPMQDSPPLPPPPPPPPPMRSIFPRYDPEVPLARQKYYPNAGSPRSSSDLPPSRLNHNTLTPPAIFPGGESSLSSSDGAVLASVESLERLWGITCGETSRSGSNTFNLNIRRIDSFTYDIGTGAVPFYTLKTDTISDLELHKTHPTKPNTKSPIVTLSLDYIENRTSATIPIFPKIAEILAREQSMELARQNKLSPTDAMNAEADAVNRVKAKETCLFEWKDAQSQYKLHYQAMMKSPSTPGGGLHSAQSNLPSCFINASVSTSTISEEERSNGPTIVLSAPKNASPSSRSADTPLVAVNLEDMTLTINANDILTNVPSLHCIDTLVAAIFTVTVSNETTKQILESIDIYAPKPEEFPDPYRPPTPNPASLIANKQRSNSGNDNSGPKPPGPVEEPRYFTTSGKQIFTTQAEREDFEHEAEVMSQIGHKRERGKTTGPKPLFSAAWPRFWKREPEVEEIDLEANIGRASNAASREPEEESIATEQQTNMKKKKVKHALVVEEIDVNRYRHYGEGSPREGEKLPKPTRAALRMLFWCFSLIMWCLTACVKSIAWALVNVTQCISSKKA